MKVHRYSEHQRRLWVHEMMHKTKTVKAICEEAGISRATLYNWQSELNKIKEEQSQVASLSWQPNDKYKMLLSVLVKYDKDKTVSRGLAKELVKRYNLTATQACSLVNLPEENYNYRPRKPEAEDKDVYAALVHLLEEKSSRSLADCIDFLQGSNPDWTVKQIRRIYRQGRLYLKRTRVKRAPSLPAEMALLPDKISSQTTLQRANAFWHIGLLTEGKQWLLFILDYNDGTPLNVLAGNGAINQNFMMQLVTKAATENGLPKKIRIPAEAPFVSRELSKWCWENKVAMHNLSMLKPENILEAEYISDDIKKQLCFDETMTLKKLQTAGENWIESFAQNSAPAINYFMKETVAG